MGFLTRDPNEFECLDHDSQEWHRCNKEEICANNLEYRPIVDDEYIDNWERPEKLDLLCEPKYKVGLLGSMFFAGACSTMFIIPLLADKWWGRKTTLSVVIVLNVIAQFGLLVCTNIIWAYVFIFILGMCFAGKVFVALTYTIEFTPVRYHYSIPFIYLLTEPVFLFLLTAWY